jgi:hypothetical protein
LLVQELLTSPDSPLYAPDPSDRIRISLVACVDAFDLLPGDKASPLAAA